MKLPVYLYGHPVLRKVAEDVDPTAPELKKLVDDMFETMYASEGVGLAAPQIGRSERIVVIDADPVAETFPECAGRKLVLINPDVEVLDGDKVTRAEGCLSLPGLSENVLASSIYASHGMTSTGTSTPRRSLASSPESFSTSVTTWRAKCTSITCRPYAGNSFAAS